MYSRAEDFFKIKNLLDVVDLFFPRLSSAGVSVLPGHGAALPTQVRPTMGCGRRKDAGRKKKIKTEKVFFFEEEEEEEWMKLEG